eukprot:Selendium_serpulae@DN4785_c0_g1_i1.p1
MPSDGDVAMEPSSSASSSSSSSASQVAPQFVVTKWSGVALWSWDLECETCSICRTHLMEKCIGCAAPEKQNIDPSGSDRCEVAWGRCSHAFHFHCISRWLEQRNVCPLDNQPWVMTKLSNEGAT